MTYSKKKITKTFNNGSLGSCNDEERSEMRNVMRFAASVSHRVFERTWRLEMIQVYLFEQNIQINLSLTLDCVTWKESEEDVQPVRVLCDRKAVVLIHRARSVIVRFIRFNNQNFCTFSLKSGKITRWT